MIVKQSEAEEKTKSGIVLPDTAKEKPTRGKVVAAGPGKLDDNGKPWNWACGTATPSTTANTPAPT